MRIALAQINPTVGDIAGNSRKIVEYIEQAKSAGVGLIVFPELAILGYPPKDLLLKKSVIDDNLRAVERIATHAVGIEVVVGYAERNTDPVGRPLHNAVAICADGAVRSSHLKTLLPTYDVFDESRYFEPGSKSEQNQIIDICDQRAGVTICEDLWNDERLIPRRLYHSNPIELLSSQGARFLLNASASPFVVDKHDFRIRLFGEQVRRFKLPLIYVNQVGGNDELVFDGCSCAFDADGRVVAQARAFEEELLIVEMDCASTPPVLSPAASPEAASRATHPDATHPRGVASIHDALVLGTRDYLHKCGFRRAVIGLSGGIDSAVTAAIAVEALGKENVTGVAMPSRYSSDHSVEDARELAKNLQIEFHLIPIGGMHDAYETALAEPFRGRSADVTEENLQARIRGATLMAFSNKFGGLLLTTGNKSEIAVGYCTLYGDMCGGLAVISDVPKTTVYELANYINQRARRELIPQRTITKPPSAELRPDQVDQDSLPPYDVLDGILYRYVELEESAATIIAAGYDEPTVTRVIRLVDLNEYKRRQAAPGLKVTSRAFGFGRRMPIAQGYRPLPADWSNLTIKKP